MPLKILKKSLQSELCRYRFLTYIRLVFRKLFSEIIILIGIIKLMALMPCFHERGLLRFSSNCGLFSHTVDTLFSRSKITKVKT